MNGAMFLLSLIAFAAASHQKEENKIKIGDKHLPNAEQYKNDNQKQNSTGKSADQRQKISISNNELTKSNHSVCRLKSTKDSYFKLERLSEGNQKDAEFCKSSHREHNPNDTANNPKAIYRNVSTQTEEQKIAD